MQQYTLVRQSTKIPLLGSSLLKLKYPWDMMHVGDYMLTDHVRPGVAAYAYGRTHGLQFTNEKTGEGFKVTRIS